MKEHPLATTVRFRGNPEIGIIVRDLEATTSFYRDGLGLPHLEDFDGPAGFQRRFACGDGAILKLMRLPDAPPTHVHPGGIFGGANGVRWITIAVDDIEAVFRRCEETGGTVPVALHEWSPGNQAGVVEDPEGNVWVELVPRSPSGADPGDPEV
jgi:catechol 2,3-dioxygenase-like lactoylglutathione lyase family enzyme